MSFYAYEIVTPPEHLPVTVSASQTALAAAVVSEMRARCFVAGNPVSLKQTPKNPD